MRLSRQSPLDRPSILGHLSSLGGQAAADLLDLLAPRDCVSCGAPGRTLCRDCLAEVTAPRPIIDRHRVGLPVAVGGWLDGALGATVRAYKSGAGRTLAAPLSAPLAAAISRLLDEATHLLDEVDGAAPGRGCLLVAVPPSLRARWSRGDDVLGRVVDRAVPLLRAPGCPFGGHDFNRARWLEPARLVRDQRTLGARGRQRNVQGSLRIRPGVAAEPGTARSVIVVDDVMTTGATLREALRAMDEAGLAERILGAAVIAATPSASGGGPMSLSAGAGVG